MEKGGPKEPQNDDHDHDDDDGCWDDPPERIEEVPQQHDASVDGNFDDDFDDDDDLAETQFLSAGYSNPEEWAACRAAGFKSKAAFEACVSLGFPQGLRCLERREADLGQQMLRRQRIVEARLRDLEDRQEIQAVSLRSLHADLAAYRETCCARIGVIENQTKHLSSLEMKVTRLRKESVRLAELQARVDAPHNTYTPDHHQLEKLENATELAAELRMAEDELEDTTAKKSEAAALSQAMESSLHDRGEIISQADADLKELVASIEATQREIGDLEASRQQLCDPGGTTGGDEMDSLRKRVGELCAQEKKAAAMEQGTANQHSPS